MDFKGPLKDSSYALVMLDLYSKWPEVYWTTSTSFEAIKKHLDNFISAHGRPSYCGMISTIHYFELPPHLPANHHREVRAQVLQAAEGAEELVRMSEEDPADRRSSEANGTSSGSSLRP